jgi:Rieske Fe-S protein
MEMTRREALGAAAVAGVCAPFLAACGASTASGGTSNGTAGGSGASSGSGAGGGATSGVTVKTSDVPVGGGILADNSNVIVTQPKAGTYMAFQAVCPHQGSALPAPVNGVITCPLHGSMFGVDGSLEGGPATRGLTSDPVTVKNGTITIQV